MESHLSQHMTLLKNRAAATLFYWTGCASAPEEANARAEHSYLASLKAICAAFGSTEIHLDESLVIAEAASVELAATSFGIASDAFEKQVARFAGRRSLFSFEMANRIVHSAAHSDRTCLEAMASGHRIAVSMPVGIYDNMVVLQPARVMIEGDDSADIDDAALVSALRLLALTCLAAQAGATVRPVITKGGFLFPITFVSAPVHAVALAEGPSQPEALIEWLSQFGSATS